jgi:hypothetical protein
MEAVDVWATELRGEILGKSAPEDKPWARTSLQSLIQTKHWCESAGRAVRGHLTEYGWIAPKGPSHVARRNVVSELAHNRGADRRDADGRLYASFDEEKIMHAWARNTLLLDEQVGSVSSGKKIRRIVAQKRAAESHPSLRQQ